MLSASAALACGGRYEQNAPHSDDAPSQGGGALGGSQQSAGGGAGSAMPMGGAFTCPDAECGPDERPVPDSNGCWHCEIDENACLVRYETYVEYRTKVIAEFASFGCKKADDCVAFPDQSDCDPECVRVVTGARRGVSDRLNLFKATACSAQCLTEPNVPCPAAAAARCVDGRCL